MKIIKKRVHCTKADFLSANDLIHISVNTNNGPELELEDGSLILYTDVATYYAIGIDDINLEDIRLKYFINEDDVADVKYENKEVIEIEAYKYNSSYFYRLILA